MTRWNLRLALALAVLLPQFARAGELPHSLVAEVRGLEMGEGEYLLGDTLDPEELAEARSSAADTYPGTAQLHRDDFNVVADAESGLILAVFQRLEDARADDVTGMINHLMLRFGEPTTSAHDQLIYWAWSRDGRIGDDAYEEAKKTGDLEVLATVKFNSTLALTPGMSNETTTESGTIYYIITSERLLEAYVGDR